jgi:gliding motility-associated-like protein
VVLYLLAFGLSAQSKRTSQWYFGYGTALDFNTTPPAVTTGFPMNQLEGSSSISDEAGQLQFYTDGRTVWTRQHQAMPNGTGLLGDESASQSALIVPKPGSTTLFYVFTAPAWADAGDAICYSVVDLQLNNGLGDVVAGQKNIRLQTPATEKLAATLHRNGKDVWVVTSQFNTNQYYAYLVTEEGVCDCPVVSAVGQVQSQFQGYLKFSPDGTRVASAQTTNALELFAFDACTGVLSYAATIPSWTDSYGNLSHLYGLCFSPDGSKLYVNTGWVGLHGTSEGANLSGCAKIFQYDVHAADLAGSQVVLYDNTAGPQAGCATWGTGAMQLGPDQKIYIAGWTYGYLHVIHNPNEAGTRANFVRDGLFLQGAEGGLGLPNFIDSYFHPNPPVAACAPATLRADFRYDEGCAEAPIRFADQSVADPPASLCYEWDFGDPGSGDANFSSIANPAHAFSAAGTYQVTLRVKSGTACRTATVRKPVVILPALRINLGPDTTLCHGASIRLGTTVPGAAYRWQDGSTDPFFTAAAPGTYWVEVTRDQCTARDSVQVAFTDLAAVDLGNDLVLCAGATVTLNATRPGVTYAWQDGTTGPTYTVRQPGTYWVSLSNGLCIVRDTLRVTYDVPRRVDLGADTTVCLGHSLKLTFPYPELDFRWSNQTSDPELVIEQAGTYWVSYKTPGTNCLLTDSLRVSFTECLDALEIPNVFTPNGDAFNQTFEVAGAPGTTWRLAVYNRWGQQVAGYETYRNDWQAEGLENGVYYYVLTSRVSGRSFKGWVHVQR